MQKKRAVVRGHDITVSLDNPNGATSVFIKTPSGKGTHKVLDLSPLLAAALSPMDALTFALAAVSAGVEGAEGQKT